jgi:hypothetical protein
MDSKEDNRTLNKYCFFIICYKFAKRDVENQVIYYFYKGIITSKYIYIYKIRL